MEDVLTQSPRNRNQYLRRPLRRTPLQAIRAGTARHTTRENQNSCAATPVLMRVVKANFINPNERRKPPSCLMRTQSPISVNVAPAADPAESMIQMTRPKSENSRCSREPMTNLQPQWIIAYTVWRKVAAIRWKCR